MPITKLADQYQDTLVEEQLKQIFDEYNINDDDAYSLLKMWANNEGMFFESELSSSNESRVRELLKVVGAILTFESNGVVAMAEAIQYEKMGGIDKLYNEALVVLDSSTDSSERLEAEIKIEQFERIKNVLGY